MNDAYSELSPDRRAVLARKGQILYEKHCGAVARATCAVSFALHQLRQGNVVVVDDLLAFPGQPTRYARLHDPEGLLPMTETLAARIGQHLEEKS